MEGSEVVARVRAARGYAGLSQKALGEKLGLSEATMKRIERGERGYEEMELREIARLCGVPYAWFTVPSLVQAVDGAADATLAERVEALERQGVTVRERSEAQVRALRDAVVELAAGNLQQARERLDQADTGRPEERPGEAGRG